MLHDEVGKTMEVNVWNRFLVTRYCNLDDEGRIIGEHAYVNEAQYLERFYRSGALKRPGAR